ncbi:MAG: hypothetical protein HRT82_16725, partial [Henriciella sp.]|nr:hypothetical protein [Henriciella sp.]
MNHQMNTRDASRDWNAEHVYKDRPACARPGSELTEPDAPIALTVDGYKSVLVAVINKHAFLRISPDGFRLITLNKSKDAYCIQGAPGAGWLQSHGTVQGLVHTLSSSA